MEITIYGPGCKNCVSLADNAKKAMEETILMLKLLRLKIWLRLQKQGL